MMHCHSRVPALIAGMALLGGCESLPEGAMGEIGRDVFGDVAETAAATASVRLMRETADSMCSADNRMCRNLTMVAMSGFTESFMEQLSQSDVRKMNDARDKAIETGEPQVWENRETGASGQITSTPAPPRPPAPTPVKVKRDRVAALPLMDAVGEPYVVTATGGVNVRGGPGTSYEVVDRLAGDDRVQAISKVRDQNWYLVGRGSVGIGYVFGDLIARWTPPADQPLDETLDEPEDDTGPDVAEVDVEMASECFTTTQTVTLGNGDTEEAEVTSCRTPDGWAQV